MVCLGLVEHGMAGKLCYGTLGYAEVRSGLVWQFRQGKFRSGGTWYGSLGKVC